MIPFWAVLLTGTLLAGPAIRPFVFTAIPDEDETRLRERFDQVARYLAQALGVPVEYVPVKSYPAAVAAFTNNQVQLAWFGGLTGVQARRAVPGSQAIAQGVEDQAFVSYFIAHRSTGLEPRDDFPAGIAGRTFTFGAKSSTSGRLMPEFYIRKHLGKAPEQAFRRVGFSDDHSKTIALVASGAYEVGAVNYTVWENELKAGKLDPSQVRVIWKTPPYPDYNWSVRGDVDGNWGKGFTARLSAALVGMKDPKLLAAFPRSGFVPARNADYDAILSTARAVGLIE
jgi:phosphonate transport system substrate-binding protein